MKPTQTDLFNKEALQKIKKQIIKESPNKKGIEIIAVTKTRTIDVVKQAIKNKIKTIGENQVQETEKKFLKEKEIRKKIELHLIGHLQSNKTNKAVSIFDVIQTVDSQKILKKINKTAKIKNKKQRIYFQVNIGQDQKKHGFDIPSLLRECDNIKNYKNIIVEGLMAILPQGKTKKENKKLFQETVSLQKKIQKNLIKTCTKTSLGMSTDYLEAIQAGATHIRIGSALFGKRKQ